MELAIWDHRGVMGGQYSRALTAGAFYPVLDSAAHWDHNEAVGAVVIMKTIVK